jgi:putative endonuclease
MFPRDIDCNGRHIKYVVYVLRCSDASFYTGWTNDLSRRIAAHRAGVASRYTRSRLPVELLAYWAVHDRSAALVAEAAFKRYTRAEKAAALLQPKILGYRIRKAPFKEEYADLRTALRRRKQDAR